MSAAGTMLSRERICIRSHMDNGDFDRDGCVAFAIAKNVERYLAKQRSNRVDRPDLARLPLTTCGNAVRKRCVFHHRRREPQPGIM